MLRSFTRSFSATAARSDYARAQILGTVGRVDFRESPSGTRYVRYSIAVNRYNKEKEQDVAYWHSVMAFHGLERLEKALRPGALVHVDASINESEYTDSNGEKQYSTLLVQERLDILRFPKKQAEEASE
ncbi:Single-stranded DNA-binding protein RIM1, mitochondrial [Candida viswanathii]|uniref:Single-stranded DNA-binding protein RIM1, mitochondrial n=1 Tax=Candida viswanathii TaxID=5486 RepID=A0A367Y3X6_9ASCO|nr:Single-stranded DNA-binding protein RIM1, mitochondrial [Candida viswanathii]